MLGVELSEEPCVRVFDGFQDRVRGGPLSATERERGAWLGRDDGGRRWSGHALRRGQRPLSAVTPNEVPGRNGALHGKSDVEAEAKAGCRTVCRLGAPVRRVCDELWRWGPRRGCIRPFVLRAPPACDESNLLNDALSSRSLGVATRVSTYARNGVPRARRCGVECSPCCSGASTVRSGPAS